MRGQTRSRRRPVAPAAQGGAQEPTIAAHTAALPGPPVWELERLAHQALEAEALLPVEPRQVCGVVHPKLQDHKVDVPLHHVVCADRVHACVSQGSGGGRCLGRARRVGSGALAAATARRDWGRGWARRQVGCEAAGPAVAGRLRPTPRSCRPAGQLQCRAQLPPRSGPRPTRRHPRQCRVLHHVRRRGHVTQEALEAPDVAHAEALVLLPAGVGTVARGDRAAQGGDRQRLACGEVCVWGVGDGGEGASSWRAGPRRLRLNTARQALCAARDVGAWALQPAPACLGCGARHACERVLLPMLCSSDAVAAGARCSAAEHGAWPGLATC